MYSEWCPAASARSAHAPRLRFRAAECRAPFRRRETTAFADGSVGEGLVTTGHEVPEDMIASLSRKEVMDKVATALIASSEFHIHVTGGLAAATFGEDGVVFNPSHRRVPPQTGQLRW